MSFKEQINERLEQLSKWEVFARDKALKNKEVMGNFDSDNDFKFYLDGSVAIVKQSGNIVVTGVVMPFSKWIA